MERHKTISVGIAHLLREEPFFGGLVINLRPRQRDDIGTMAITPDGRLLWSKEFVDQLPIESVAGILAHEALHLGLGHPVQMARMPEKHRELFNLAADAIVNGWLRSAGFQLTDGAVYLSDLVREGLLPPGDWPLDTEAHKTLTARSLLDKMLSWREAQPQPQGGDGQPDQGGQQSKGQGSPSQGPQNGPQSRQPQGPSGPGAGGQEKGSQGQSEGPGEPDSQGPGQPDPVKKFQGRDHGLAGQDLSDEVEGDGTERQPTREELDRLAERWKRELLTAAANQATRRQGQLPGWLLRQVGAAETAKARVPWPLALARAVKSLPERSYRRPSRRHLWRKSVLPGRVPGRRRVVAVIDTSGSIGRRELAQFLKVLGDLERMGEAKVLRTLAADAAVQREWKGLPDSRIPGGGGTDFRPALRRAAQLHPDVVVYITDGYGANYPRRYDGLEVVWVLVPDGKPQPWGLNIEMEVSDD